MSKNINENLMKQNTINIIEENKNGNDFQLNAKEPEILLNEKEPQNLYNKFQSNIFLLFEGKSSVMELIMCLSQ